MTTPALPSATQGVDTNTIAYALARNECGEKLPLGDALLAIGVDPAQPGVRQVLTSVNFKTKYAEFVKELKDSGESFKLKARVMAEELLKQKWELVHDVLTPPSVKSAAINDVVEWADLNPKKKNLTDVPPPPSITIQIDLGGDRAETIDVTPSPNQLQGA